MQQKEQKKATLEMKYVKSPSLCKEKSCKKPQGANMGCVFRQIRTECGKGEKKWRIVTDGHFNLHV
jgi:hypothetical protein